MKILVSGDQHLRSDPAICRQETEDEWKQFQKERIEEIIYIANKNKADIAFTGDMFDVPRVAPELTSMLIEALQSLKGVAYFLSGNHEKAFHKEENVGTSSIGIIKALAGDNSGRIRYCPAIDAGGDQFEHYYKLSDDIVIIHTLSFPSEELIPFGCDAYTPDALFSKYDAKWLFVGDNHLAFHVEQDGRHIISSGCMTVQTAKEMKYTPSVYLVDTDKDEVTKVELFHDPTKVSNEHITKKREHDESLESAIKLLQEVGDDTTLDYVANLMVYCDKNKASLGARDIINEIREEKA